MVGTGRMIANGPLAISGSIGLDEGRVLEIHGGGTWSAGSINLNPTFTGNAAAGVVRNFAGSTFNNSFDGSLFTQNFDNGAENGASALFDNQGILQKSGGTGTSTLSAAFNNSGTVNVNAGTLNFSGGGTDVGGTYAGTGATLQFGGGTRPHKWRPHQCHPRRSSACRRSRSPCRCC